MTIEKRRLFLLKHAAKKIVSDLRKASPYFSEALQKDIFVTKKYLQHVLYAKHRNLQDTEERLIITIFLSDIITKGILTQTREESNRVFCKLEYPLETEILSVIIMQENHKSILLSSFVKYKKNPPV